MVPTQYPVGRVDPAAVGLIPNSNIPPEKMEQIRQSLQAQTPGISNAPKTGTITNLVVFVRFSDEAESIFADPPSYYTDMFDSSTAGANSMRNYYLEASYNALTIGSNFYPTPPGSAVISYQDTHPRNYYRPYNEVTNPDGYQTDAEKTLREHTLLKDAVNYVNGLGQFPSGPVIDADSDGYVDSITFVISGSPDGWSDLLWPHKWNLFTYVVTINGKQVNEYAFQLDSVLETGVLAHEMFHVLGAPDLYHYSSDGLHPVGKWDVMEYNLNPPQHMGCQMKYEYGTWISSIPQITEPGTYTLNPLTSATNNCFKIASPYSSTEFFLLEYRRQAGSTFENSLPGTGLLVYRINSLEAGNGNADGPPDEIYIFRPGGDIDTDGNYNIAHFSSTVGRDKINLVTDPTSFLSSGAAGGLSLCNIGASGDTISFDYGNCGAARFSPTSHDFGDQIAGTSSGATTFILTNSGTGSLVLSTLTTNGEFSLTADLCSGQTIPAAGTCTFGVIFSPTTAGVKNGLVAVPTNEDYSPSVVHLTGNGTGLQTGPTFVVNLTSDTGVGACYVLPVGCTLRDAITAASAGDTITFDSSLSGGTIRPASTLTLSKNVTIDGSALATQITINGDTDNDGDGDVHLFTINSGVAATLNSLVLTKGYSTSLGGAILNSGTLTVMNTTFSSNSVQNVSGYWGGAIYSVGPVDVSGSTFSGNTAYTGGAIAINTGGTLDVTNTTFSSNSSGSSGGAVYSVGSVVVAGSTFNSNTTSSGGAIYLPWLIYLATGSSLNVTNTTFSSNNATSSGGAIYSSVSVTVADSTFSSNTATNGGAIRMTTGGSLSVTTSTFSGNSTSNTSGWGGVIFNSGSTTVANSTFSGNTAYVGGSIANSGGTLNVTNATFSGNTASFGGGIYNTGTLATLANTILANSTSGGDCRNAGTITAEKNNLIENTGTNACGLVNGTNGDIIGFDPSLSALQNNGGPTSTFIPLPGSKAIDAGDNTTCAAAPINNLDQRGEARPVDYDNNGTATCDIGSSERQADENLTETVSDGETQSFGPAMTTIIDNAGGNTPGETTVTRHNLPPGGGTPDAGDMPFWVNIAAATGSGLNVNLTLCYTDSEIPVGVTEGNLVLYRWNGSAWTNMGFTTRDTTGNCVTLNGVTDFSQWALGDPAAGNPTALTLDTFTVHSANSGERLPVILFAGAALLGLVTLNHAARRRG